MAVTRIRDKLTHRPAVTQFEAAGSDVCPEESVESSITGIGWIRLAHDSKDDSTHPRLPSLVFSPHFLEQASVAFSNAREDDLEMRGNTLDFSSVRLTRNKLHTACAIVMLLQKQYMEMTVQDAHLPAWPKNDRQFHAARYRRGQHLILYTAIHSVIHSLRRLVGLEPSWPRDKRVARLDHILKAGPKEFLTDFRAIIHLGFGTRNAEKLRQQMLVESAFTLWLCGLWLWVRPATVTGSNALRAPLPVIMAQWVQFISKIYGEESNIGKLWEEIPASKEGELLARSCQTIIEATIAKNPLTIYNHSEATTSRLLWCLRVVREESFMCPNLEGKAGDENDEITLYLQGNSH
ncbi:MAG: hypothetical protein Q9222_007246 [Ikaeria aurantiellina]